jgi:hypothetical protein
MDSYSIKAGGNYGNPGMSFKSSRDGSLYLHRNENRDVSLQIDWSGYRTRNQ